MNSDVWQLPLLRSDHSPEEEGLAVMEAVAYVAGEPLSNEPACASPVLTAWMRAWGDNLDDEARQQLRRYVLPLANSRTDLAHETVRQWQVIDWFVRICVPVWLHAAGLYDESDRLITLPEIVDPRALNLARTALEAARRAGHQAELLALASVDVRLQVDPTTWKAVIDGTCTAIESTVTMIEPAEHAVGYANLTPHEVPPSWWSARLSILNSVAAIGWSAVGDLTSSPQRTWSIPADDARQIAHSTPRGVLEAGETAARNAGHQLIESLLGFGPTSP
jgi:hypothetical protein